MSNYVRRYPDRDPWGHKKLTVAAMEIGKAICVATQREVDIWHHCAKQGGMALRQRALHPYARQKPGQPPPPRCYELTRIA
jgi:hypothetical protein